MQRRGNYKKIQILDLRNLFRETPQTNGDTYGGCSQGLREDYILIIKLNYPMFMGKIQEKTECSVQDKKAVRIISRLPLLMPAPADRDRM